MGFDTIHFSLSADEAKVGNFFEELPLWASLDNLQEVKSKDGNTCFFCGYLQGEGKSHYRVYVNSQHVTIGKCSLAKWHLGNNVEELDRKETRRAIERMSDLLHLPIDEANIKRMDFAVNIFVKYPVEVYLNHFGDLSRYNKKEQDKGIYYTQTKRQYVIYDKIAEQRRKKSEIPELYKGKNLLRIEHRYENLRAFKGEFGIVRGETLYNEAFYNVLLKGWRDLYYSIQKINDVVINFGSMGKMKDFERMAYLAFIEKAGGYDEMLKQIKEAQKKNTIDKNLAYDIRKKLKEAITANNVLVYDDSIKELDNKVKMAVKFY